MKYEVQFELNRGEWVTLAKRSDFNAACAKARAEFAAMKGAYMTAVVREDDNDCAALRRTLDNNFSL